VAKSPSVALCRTDERRLADSRGTRAGTSRAARLALLTGLLCLAEAAFAIPRFTSTPVTGATEDVAYRYDITTADSQNGWRLVTATVLPSWLTLSNVSLNNGRARLSGRPTQAHVGTHPVALQVRNLRTNSTAVQNFTVIVANVNDAPVITGQTPNPIPLERDTPLTITLGHLLVTDPDDTYPGNFTLTVLDGTNYTRSGDTITPGANFVGTLTVPVRVNDGTANSGNFNLVVSVRQTVGAILSLSIEATPTPALVDTEVEWRFTIANTGQQPADAVELTASFAGNPFRFTALASCTATPVANGQELRCTAPIVAAGANVTVALRGAAAADGDVFARARVQQTGAPAAAPGESVDATLHIARTLAVGAAQRLAGPDHSGVAAGDADGDGHADLALSRAGDGAALEVYLNVVDGDVGPRRLADLPLSIDAAGGASNVTLVDLDGDSDLDLVATNDSGGANTVYRNTGGGTFAAVTTLAGGATHAVAAADFDGDGAIDLAFANTGANVIYLNRGASGFSRVADLGSDDSRDVVAADFDRDGRPDLVFANGNGPSRYYRNLGAGGFAAGVVVDSLGARSVAAGDFTGDGRPDLVFGVRADATGPPANTVYRNDPGTGGAAQFMLAARIGAAPTARVLAADVDGDGTTDVVALNTTGTHQVYRGDGTGAFTLHPVQFGWPGVVGAALINIGLDSAPDLAVAGATSSATFYNDGRGGFGLGDTTAPVIEVTGNASVTVTFGTPYTDAGATATDDVDGSVTARLTVTNPVDTAVLGTYTITYQVSDSAGNVAQATRTVHVTAREGVGGGGGGTTHPVVAAILAVLLLYRRRRPTTRAARR
jgi:hypothetical protein